MAARVRGLLRAGKIEGIEQSLFRAGSKLQEFSWLLLYRLLSLWFHFWLWGLWHEFMPTTLTLVGISNLPTNRTGTRELHLNFKS